MAEAVIDASTLIAFLMDESVEMEQLEDVISNSLISSVNASEVATVLRRIGIPLEKIETLIEENVGKIISFDKTQAMLAASLWDETKSYGLSLGDRSCLALAQSYNLPVYTADKIWKKLTIKGLDIKLIR